MKRKWTHAKGHTERLATKDYLIRKRGVNVDRTSFRDFLGLASGDKVPDARNTLTNLVYNVCRYEQIVRLGMN